MDKYTKPNLKQFNPLKILNHWDVINKIIEGENTPPITGEIDLTNACNHRCAWCTYGDLRTKGETIPIESIKTTIKDLAEMGTKAITFTGGGEPLVHKHFAEIIRFTHEQGLEIGLISNGGKLNEELCKVIVENCSWIRLSLDAGTNELHQKLHNPVHPGEDNLDNIFKNLELLAKIKKEKETNIEIGAAYLVAPENFQEIALCTERSKKAGAQYIQIRPAYNYKDFDKKCIDGINENIVEARKFASDEFMVIPLLYRFDKIERYGRSYHQCLAHRVNAIIGADAKMYLCCQLKLNPKFAIGDLNEKSVKEIWNSEERKKICDKIDVSNCPPCKYDKYNEILDYLNDKERRHKNFL